METEENFLVPFKTLWLFKRVNCVFLSGDGIRMIGDVFQISYALNLDLNELVIALCSDGETDDGFIEFLT